MWGKCIHNNLKNNNFTYNVYDILSHKLYKSKNELIQFDTCEPSHNEIIILKLIVYMYVPPNAEPSSPDVSLASTSLITSCSWQTLSTLSSDHLPILNRIRRMKTTSTPGLRRTYVNLKKSNWDRYK